MAFLLFVGSPVFLLLLLPSSELTLEGFDLAFVDTWRDASDGAPMYKKMKELEHLSPNTKFLYWIENFLISRVRAENFARVMGDIDDGNFIPESFNQVIENIKKI